MTTVAGAPADASLGTIRTQIPSRLDRLPWSRFHWRIVIGLGTAWILDGLEVTIVGSVASRLTQHGSGISITAAGIGLAAALYVVGACLGALVFGHLTDRFGRKKLFLITLGLYMAATAVTALSFAPWFFFIFRFLTGAGIGGEYSAINSAIDELIPARARGRIDLVINGSYWIGSIAGSGAAILFLSESIFPADIGWRLTFVLGLILASAVMLVRRHVPESPRWLFIHGREEEAEALVDQIESDVQSATGATLAPVTKTLTVRQRRTIGFSSILKTAFRDYPKRTVLCLALFVGQAFIYNGITFDLGTLMSKFFHVSSGITPVFLIMYAAANFLGPLVLGRMFDTVGRIPMITGTYLGSAILGLLLAGLFAETGVFNRWTFIVVVMATFFMASAGASAAYLTTSEIFPMETRALAIAFYYAIGTAIGGIAGPLLFGPLISTGSRGLVALAFTIGSVLMIGGAVAELAFGIKAEGQPLEDIATPLTAQDAEGHDGAAAADAETAVPVATAPAAGAAVSSLVHTHRQQAAEHRARAAEHRARAAEHRARYHEVLAGGPPSGSPAGTAQDTVAQVEATLAEVSDTRALAEDELAAAADARADLHQQALEAPGHDGHGARGEDGRDTPGAERVRAAELRARAHQEESEALLAAAEEDVRRHRLLAAAAVERARSAEQRQMAAAGSETDTPATPELQGPEGDGPTAGPREEAQAAAARRRRHKVAMHGAWAEMHRERAEALEHRAAGRTEEAARHDREADVAAERAQAIAFRVEAEDHRMAAAAEHEAEESERSERRRHDEQVANELAVQARSDDERIRARLAQRRRQQVEGLRRYRPGPGRLGTAPGFPYGPPPDEALDHEVVAIERALDAHGPTDRRELARMVGADYWGPGVFSEALRQAVEEGSVRRLSRRVYAPADDRDGGTGERGTGDGGVGDRVTSTS